MIAEPIDSRQEYFDKYEEPAQHFAALMAANIITLDIRPWLLFPLWEAGIRTVGELIRQYRQGLSGIRRIGVKAAAEIETLLDNNDLINIC